MCCKDFAWSLFVLFPPPASQASSGLSHMTECGMQGARVVRQWPGHK